MQKNRLVCLAAICLFSGLSLAEVKYTGKDGYLVMPDVNVDNQAYYDSVTLKLDLANGTFSIVDAKPKPAKVSDKPLQQFVYQDYTFGFLGCGRTGEVEHNTSGDQRVVVCVIQIINNLKDRILNVGNMSNIGDSIQDNLDKIYVSHKVSSGGQESGIADSLDVFLPQGQPVKISYTYSLNINSSSIKKFEPMGSYPFGCQSVDGCMFKNIQF